MHEKYDEKLPFSLTKISYFGRYQSVSVSKTAPLIAISNFLLALVTK